MPGASTFVCWALWPLLLGIGLQLVGARLLSARGKGVLAFVSCFASLAAVLSTYPGVRDGSALDFRVGTWDGPLAFALHVDALSLLFAFMATGIGAMALLYSVAYMQEERACTRFYSFILAFIAGMITLVYSANLFIFYLGWELVGLCSFSLVGFWYKNPQAVRGARKVLLMTHLSGYGLLAAILVLYARTGTAIWTDPQIGQAMSSGVFVLMVVALAAKSVQFPLHTWIPDAMAAPTPVSALLHAACYVKAGVYLAARMHTFTHWPHAWNIIVLTIGTVTMLVGVLYALIQTDLKRLLAFSTVSQIGYMIIGIGLGTPLGIAAGLLHCINHGFFKSGLFLAAGSVQHAAGTRDMDQLGGLASKMPRTTAVWMISVGSMMGIPLMSGFASKWLVYTAALQKGMVIPALAAWIASIGTVFAGVKATSQAFLGSTTERTRDAHESPTAMTFGMGALSAVTLLLGVAPQIVVRWVIDPVLASMGMPNAVGVSWFGMTDSMGTWSTTTGLVMAVVAAIVGGIVYVLVARPARVVVSGGGAAFAGAGGGAFTGGEPIIGSTKLPASDFSALPKSQWAPLLKSLDVDVYYQRVWSMLADVAGGAQRVCEWLERNAVAAVGVALVLTLIAVERFVSIARSAQVGTETAIPRLVAAATGLALIALVAAAAKRWQQASLMLLTGAPAVLACFMESPIARLALLETASVLALLLVWSAAKERSAAWTFLAVIGFSAATLVPGTLMLEHGNVAWARPLLLAGFLLKLGVLPFIFWLPKIARQVPALVLATVVCVLDIAAFREFSVVAQSAPWMLQPRAIWLGVATATALVASVLMLAERDIKRLLALSSIEDIGFLTFGVVSASALGLEGAVIGAASHALAKTLLFISVSSPEANGELHADARGLATRYPVSAAGFLVGMLAVLGVPPTFGFAGRWRLYGVAAQQGNGWLLVMIVSSMIALFAYVRAFTRTWWGTPSEENASGASTPVHSWLSNMCMGLLAAALVIAGVLPFAVEKLFGGVR